MSLLSPEQINQITSLSDPTKLAKLKDAGLPTIELGKIKEVAEKRLASMQQDIIQNVSGAVTSMMEHIDKLIRDKVSEVEKLSEMTSMTRSKALTDAQATISNLKQAKEHALTSGNFVPLLAHLHPDVNLKSLSRATVVLPKLP